MSVCITTRCCLIKKSGLVISLGNLPHLQGYCSVLEVYRNIGLWCTSGALDIWGSGKGFRALHGKARGTNCHSLFTELHRHWNQLLFGKAWTNGKYSIQKSMLFMSSSPKGIGKLGQQKAMPDSFSRKPATSESAGPCSKALPFHIPLWMTLLLAVRLHLCSSLSRVGVSYQSSPKLGRQFYFCLELP